MVVKSEVRIRNNIPILNKALIIAYKDGLETFGQVAEIQITATIDRGVPPPNAPSTIAAKGSSQPLFDTGQLYGQISHEVRDGGKSVVVGVMGSRAGIAMIHEFGLGGQHERSFIRSTFNDSTSRSEMMNGIKKEVKQAISKSTIK